MLTTLETLVIMVMGNSENVDVNSKGPGIFSTPLFYEEWSHGALGPHLGRPEGRKRVCGAAWYPGRATTTRFALVAPMSSVFALISSSWPKIIYKRGPDSDPGARRTTKQKHEMEAIPTKIGGGNAAGSHLQPLQQHLLRLHDEEGVVHPRTMGLWQ